MIIQKGTVICDICKKEVVHEEQLPHLGRFPLHIDMPGNWIAIGEILICTDHDITVSIDGEPCFRFPKGDFKDYAFGIAQHRLPEPIGKPHD